VNYGELYDFFTEQRLRMMLAGPGPNGRYDIDPEALEAALGAAAIHRGNRRGRGGDLGLGAARLREQPPVQPARAPKEGQKKHRRWVG
jgi:hypothetical protein